MNETIKYLISFLLYGHNDAVDLVGYTRTEEEASKYKLNILPSLNSPLFDPAKNWQDFYPEVEQALSSRGFSDHTDILSVACFFLSRAEETVVTERDEHGRFLARHSLIGKHKLTAIPLLDEYSRHLMKRLQLPLPEQRCSSINLTHDVDMLEQYRHLRGFAGGLKRGRVGQALSAIMNREKDPAWTFPWMLCKDKGFNTIYFLKAGTGKGYDYPQYNLKGSDFRSLLSLLQTSGAQIGLHSSYAAGEWHEGIGMIEQEKQRLESVLTEFFARQTTISKNRHHFLRSTSIDNMQQLADAGITDDYSMAFADCAGFRLLTSRPVRWINPKTLKLTTLTLHPLTAMDRTLSDNKYMNLTEEEAYYTCQQLIDKTRQNGGEINLLWHNTSFDNISYHRSLYTALVDYLKNNE